MLPTVAVLKAAAVALTFTFSPNFAECPHTTRDGEPVAACVRTWPDRATIYYPQGGMTVGTLWHELGHVYDAQKLTDEDRARLTIILGRDDNEWRAEAFRWCATYGPRIPDSWYAVYGFTPYKYRVRAMCRVFTDRAGSGR